MPESELHPYVEMIIREARRPVTVDAAARERIMAAIRAEPRHRRRRFWHRLIEPRVLTLSPVGSLALAAGLVGIGVFAGLLTPRRDGPRAGHPRDVAATATPQLPVHDTVVKFFFVAPQAARVSVVGDFNDWNESATPMVRSAGGGLWTLTLPLPAGRHTYAFVADGQWTADPSAPLAPDDGFGHANSVVLVGRGSSL